MRRKRLIPFKLTPASWFLCADNKRHAEIDYYYENGSYEWKIEKAKITYQVDHMKLQEVLLGIEKEFGKISDYSYDIQMLDLKYDKMVDEYYYNKALIEIDFKHENIDEKEKQKRIATLNEEPWGEINLISDPENPDFGTFVPDYNSYYVDWLRDNGYEGDKAEDVIDNYINHICKYVAIEKFDGVGDFSEIMNETDSQADAYSKRRTKPSVIKNNNGKTSYE